MGIQHPGLIGVGLMGHGIAANILRQGYPLGLLAHPGNRPSADLHAAGATEFAALNELVAASDVILLCVTGSPQVEEIILGENGVASCIRPGQLVADLSTVEPASTARVHEALIARGAKYLDLPMTRTPKEAEAGRLNLLAGGDADTLEALRPLLSTFAENIYHAGPVGAGHALKLLHNFVSLGHSALLAEAAACAARTSVDMETFVEVLRSGGGDSAALRRLAPYITERDEAGFRFSIANCAKDMSYYTAMAEHHGAAASGARAIRDLYRHHEAAGHGDLPVPRLIDLLGEPQPER